MSKTAHTPLKPCPFCKSPAEPIERHNPMSKWRHSIDCTSCGMSGPVEASRADAITSWNARPSLEGIANPDAVPEAIEALRWACDTLQEINPSNYDHDDVCDLNASSVEVFLGLQAILSKLEGGAK